MSATGASVVSRVRTLDSPGLAGGDLVDITIADGHITAVTPTRGKAGDVDGDGALCLPGLWDHHTHFSTHSLIFDSLDLTGTETADDIVHLVRDHLRGAPTADLVLGFGFRSGGWPVPPTAVQLDEVAAVPVALVAGDMHSVWLNGAGLAAAGVPDHPSAFLVEDDAFDAISRLMEAQTNRLDQAAQRTARAAASRGVVGIVDMEMRWALGTWARRQATAPLPLRVEAATYPADLDRLVEAGLRTGDHLGDHLVVGPLKIIFDGSMSTKTALCSHPYANPLPHLPHGMANFSNDDLDALLARATAHGISAAVHAIGDEGCRRVLDSFGRTGAAGTIEHAQFVQPLDVHRFRDLGVAASVQPSHLVDDQHLVDRIWPWAGSNLFPLRAFLDAGVELRFGSDAPVSPLDPWATMSAAVNRAHHPDQAITVREALAASTRTTIAPGQPADLVLVDRSPGAVLAGNLDVDEVLATVVGGRVTHRSV